MFGVNDAYVICDFLDVLYVADKRWIDHHRLMVNKHGCEMWCHDDTRMHPDHKANKDEDAYLEWNKVTTKSDVGFSVDRDYIHRGNHSGYQVANLAYLMGCATLILIGYDGHNGGQHFFGQHPAGTLRVKTNFERFNKNWIAVAEQLGQLNLNIINCTPGSAIDVVPSRRSR